MSVSIKCRDEIIKSYMEKENIGLNKLAREIGISPSTLSKVLSKQRNPGQVVVVQMLNYFDLKFEDLFYYDQPLTKVNDVRNKKQEVI